MINIQIAGAGAGKTYGLARDVSEYCKENSSSKVIYAVTFTNAAKEKIESEIISQIGHLPECLAIETVHSFLLNEVIYPYSSYITNDVFQQMSTAQLPSNVRFRNHSVGRLKRLNIIHASNVYSVARKILDRNHSNNNSRAKKLKVERVISFIKSRIDRIYLDEAQDLDLDALRAFSCLGVNGLHAYMIGDPKQSIKYPKALTSFIDNLMATESDKVNLLPINNITRRVPTEILNVSNSFCYPEQEQTSISDLVGELLYIESTHEQFDQFIRDHIDSDSIVCIDKKAGNYSTNGKIRGSFDPKISEMIATSSHGLDPELIVKVAHSEFCENVRLFNFRHAYRDLCQKYSIAPSPQEYRITESYAQTIAMEDTTYKVSSIDAVKGLDAETCIVVLSPTFFKYFMQQGLSNSERFNKVWKQVYVAITRAKRQLIFVIDPVILPDLDLSLIKTSIESKGFASIEL